MLQASLGRATEDDRDHYGKKRLDMAGNLMAALFRQVFRTFTDDMAKHIEKEIRDPNKKDVNLHLAFKHESLTRSIRSAISTGNWGKDKHGQVQKTGVS
jgi:DNA-directed RNA polymerase II subunit RPB2